MKGERDEERPTGKEGTLKSVMEGTREKKL